MYMYKERRKEERKRIIRVHYLLQVQISVSVVSPDLLTHSRPFTFFFL